VDTACDCEEILRADAAAMRAAGERITAGDMRCLLAGHVARVAIQQLGPVWNVTYTLQERMELARQSLQEIMRTANADTAVMSALSAPDPTERQMALL